MTVGREGGGGTGACVLFREEIWVTPSRKHRAGTVQAGPPVTGDTADLRDPVRCLDFVFSF